MKYLSTTLSKTVFATMLFAMAVSLFTTPASATIVFNGSGAASNTFQQTLDNPCVIADNSCKEPTNFFDTIRSGGPGNYDLTSPVYADLTNFTTFSGDLIPVTFRVGIDSNIATGAGLQTLDFFKTFSCDSNGLNCTLDLANSYLTPTALPNNNNGNGFSDATLSGFSLTPGGHYEFEASVSNQTDGMEQFFILPMNSQPIPEPVTMSLVGAGLVGLFFLRRKRQT